jgi:hypothetical protein
MSVTAQFSAFCSGGSENLVVLSRVKFGQKIIEKLRTDA